MLLRASANTETRLTASKFFRRLSLSLPMHALLRIARLRPLSVLALAGLAIHVAALARFSTPETFWSVFSLWVTAPAFATLILGILVPRVAQSASFCLLTAAPLLFGVAMYLSLLVGRPDAQTGLVFLLTPLWQLVALPFAWLAAAIIGIARESAD